MTKIGEETCGYGPCVVMRWLAATHSGREVWTENPILPTAGISVVLPYPQDNWRQ